MSMKIRAIYQNYFDAIIDIFLINNNILAR